MSTRFFTLSIAFGIAAMSTTSYAADAVKADFNGDGFADVATSIPFKDVAGVADAGAVQILYSDGQGGGLTAANDQILDRTNCPFSNAGDRFGAAMAAGDFNGDTFADLAIGIPFADVPGVNGTVQDAGAVLIVYGTEAASSATMLRPSSDSRTSLASRANRRPVIALAPPWLPLTSTAMHEWSLTAAARS